MRTDPRAACRNAAERLGWAILHDLVAHPLMAITNWSRPSLRFHDWTSFYAWPRAKPDQLRVPVSVPSRFGNLIAQELSPGIWRIAHGHVHHALTTNADDAIEAVEKAEAWFESLADAFGGKFAPIDSAIATQNASAP